MRIITTYCAGVLFALGSMAGMSIVHAETNSQTASAQVMPNYQVRITQPSDSRAYQKPGQSIDIQVQVAPSLRANDTAMILLDGHQVATGLSASIATVQLNPGEHTLSVLVKNEQTGAETAPVNRTIYVIQNTYVRQQRQAQQAEAERIEAYNRLPWYKKAYVQLRQQSVPDNAKIPNKQGTTQPNPYGNRGSAF
ncbi:hypothetical protein [Psychrobacter sp. I-STPA6b]|uniref:hypothetical protein n=1 Tax=Psychrobacter sp. I-STPA6b TaxID=2585718 RepID=UPI001D0BF921|nr:hypothetical protein [Psychrobacter sp. I-STPA6b]